MKSLILLVCVLVCANALDQALIEEIRTNVQEIGIECAEQEKATPEDIEALMNSKAPVTHEGRCVIFCVSKKLNLMKEDGTVNPNPESDWLNKVKADDPEIFSKLEDLHKLCAERVEVKTDGCDASLELASCGKYEGQKAGLDEVLAH